MAVEIEFVNVILRKSAVEAKFPGGLDGFVRQGLANYVEDEHILRVGFMSTSDAYGFVEKLHRAGLRDLDEVAPDLAVISDDEVPAWLTVGKHEGRAACWLSDRPPGKVIGLDRGMMLRCRAFGTIPEIMGLLSRCGAEVREPEPQVDAETVLLECERGAARCEVEIFMDFDGRPIGVVGQRDISRRSSFEVDVALMRDLTSALEGAES